MKRFGRKMKKTGVTLVVILLFLGLAWAMSHMGGILTWLLQNWLPLLVGFVLATVGGALADLILGDEADE